MAANTTEQQLQDIDSSVVMFLEGALKIANTVKGICTFAREGHLKAGGPRIGISEKKR